MSKGVFTEKGKKPDGTKIRKAVGHAWKEWKSLIDFLSGELKLKGELRFYGINYGWALRFVRSGKSVVALYPDRDSFTAQIIMKREHVESALAKGVSAATRKAVEQATDFKEGRWVFVRIDSKTGIGDVMTLVNARLSIR